MADHKHGDMEIRDQEKTFAGFMKFTQVAVIVIVGLLIFLALVNG